MIRPPKRAVTRFFIPLIDVLILLFCIFLLMPYVEKGAVGGARLTAGEAELLKGQLAELQRRIVELEGTRESPQELRDRITYLEDELRKGATKRVEVKSFRFDRTKAAKQGALSYLETTPEGDRVRVVVTEKKAAELVAQDLANLKGEKKELLYVILIEPGRFLHPDLLDKNDILRWFGPKVDVRWDEIDTGSGGTRP